MQVAASPCWETALPDVISASLSLDAETHAPVERESAYTRFFLSRQRPSLRDNRSADPQYSAQQLQSGKAFRDCSHFVMFRPPSLLAIPVAPTAAALPQGGHGVYVRAERALLPSHASNMLAVRIGQLTAGDLHPIKLTALSAAPIPALSPVPVNCPRPLVFLIYQSPSKTQSCGRVRSSC